MGKEDFKRQYEALRAHSEDLLRQLDELRHGHIQIDRLNIDYTLPDEVRSYHHWLNRILIWIAASTIGLFAVGFAYLADGAADLFRHQVSGRLYLAFAIRPVDKTLILPNQPSPIRPRASDWRSTSLIAPATLMLQSKDHLSPSESAINL